MKRVLVIGDIHGGYLALQQVLERANVNQHDQLIFLGDYVDGWSDSDKVIDLLLQLKETNRCLFLRGNHESLLTNWFLTKQKNPQWLHHGGSASVATYKTLSEETVAKHLHFLQSLTNYHIDSQGRLFVHAGFSNPRGVEAEFFEEYLYWDRSLWEMVMAMDPSLTEESPLYPQRLKHYSEIFIGHSPVTKFGFDTPTNFANVWNIDTGAAFMGKISIMDIDSKVFWQSDSVASFYPNEKGRN